MKLMPPMRFRFHEDDREQYGSDWCVYDESALLRVPARQLIEIERQIGMSVLTMLRRSRAEFTDANLAAMWLARRLAGVQVKQGDQMVSESFDKFTPLVHLATWEPVPATDDVDPPAPTSSTTPPSEEA